MLSSDNPGVVDTMERFVSTLLNAEHESLEQWLHGELGQNLVAIKSFARSLMDGAGGMSEGDMSEVAGYIHQIADSAFLSTYNLMQELRSAEIDNKDFSVSLQQCVLNADLEKRGIGCELAIADDLEQLDAMARSFVLRNLRCLLNFSRDAEKDCHVILNVYLLPAERKTVLEYTHLGLHDESGWHTAGLPALLYRVEATGGSTAIDNQAERLQLKLMMNTDSLTKPDGL